MLGVNLSIATATVRSGRTDSQPVSYFLLEEQLDNVLITGCDIECLLVGVNLGRLLFGWRTPCVYHHHNNRTDSLTVAGTIG